MSKRIISLGVAFAILLTFALGRCGYINFSNSYKVDSSYNSITVDISTLFTNIYSRNGVLLNNNTHSLYAVIKPSEKSMAELKYLYSNDDIKYITDELKKGYPIVMPVKNYAYTKYIRLEEIVNQNNDNMLCRHLIDKNFSGLEKYVDKKIGSLSINYSVDALGRVLDGDNGTIINKNYNSIDGVKISIDEKLQKIAEVSSKKISKGSVVILDTNTSQILASVSLGGDYLNRSLRPYAIGSIFKIVVAAAALDSPRTSFNSTTGFSASLSPNTAVNPLISTSSTAFIPFAKPNTASISSIVIPASANALLTAFVRPASEPVSVPNLTFE